MYIRRKVYSVLTDDCGQEKLFSTNEISLEDYEDYYVDDRYFAERERDQIDASIGGLLGGAVGLAGASGYDKIQKNLLHKKKESLREKIREERGSLKKFFNLKNRNTKAINSLSKKPSLKKEERKTLKIAEKEVKALNQLINHRENNIKNISGEIKSAIKKVSNRNKVARWAIPAAGATLGAALAYGIGHKKKD